MSKTVNASDLRYFGQFVEGYNPYSTADLELVVGTLAAHVAARGTAQSFLEVGCASGQFSAELSQRLPAGGVDCFGLDIAQPVLARYPFHKLCGTAFAMPLRDASMDVVCCPASLHHLAPFERALAEIDRVLKPGGLMYCVEPNFYHPQRRWFMRLQPLYRLYRDANDVPIRPDWLERHLVERGYRILENRPVNLTFAKPGVLQKTQNLVARVPWPASMRRFLYPWFIFAAEKKAAAGTQATSSTVSRSTR